MLVCGIPQCFAIWITHTFSLSLHNFIGKKKSFLFTMTSYIFRLFTKGIIIRLPCDKWVPVTTAWRVHRLRMEERPPICRVAANIANKHSRTTDKGWSSSLGVGRDANNSSLLKRILLRNIHRQSLRPGLILWYDLTKGRGTWDHQGEPLQKHKWIKVTLYRISHIDNSHF
jgi:hypothetical protein